MTSGRWDLFRRLCRYYRDCLRFDEHDQLRFRDHHRGDSWAGLGRELALELGRHEAAAAQTPLTSEWEGLLATARQHQDWCCFLGYPLLQTRRQGQDWQVPVLLVPVVLERAGSGLILRRSGPILPNQAALELLFNDTLQRQDCCERIGLVPAELGGSVEERYDSDLETLVERLQATGALGEGCDLDPALVGVTRRGQYHRRLQEELHLLAEATPEVELEASALRHVFATGSPPAVADRERPEPTPLVCQHPLDPAQRAAVTAALHQPITVVTGPPGTGKSAMVKHVLVNQALRRRGSLLASRNHQALDAVEPALNALSPRDTLIVRTSHHGQSRSWRHGLLDLLERSDADLADEAAAGRRWQDALQAVTGLETDLATVGRLGRRYEAGCREWRELIAATPLSWRPLLAGGDWPGPDVSQVDDLRARWQRLQSGGGLRRLLPPGEAARRRELLEALNRITAALGDEDLPAPEDDPEQRWPTLFSQLERAARAVAAWQRCRDLEHRLGALRLDRAAVLDHLGRAHGDCWRAGIALLAERAAAAPPADDQRQALANLRAAVATFGIQRWAGSYREHFPLLLDRRPLWACSNLSAPATLPRAGGLFDLLVIDEASQCDIPSIIPLLFRCRRALVVGDPQQLAHISRLSPLQDERLLASHGLTGIGLQRFGYRSTSAFRLLRETPGVPTPILLTDHYRCHPQIAALFNRAFYRRRLRVCTAEEGLRAPSRWGAGCHWHEVAAPLLAAAHGACAPAEAEAIADLLRALEADGFDGSLGIVTPFRQQVHCLRQRIETATSAAFRQRSKLLIATAHGFQGDERDCLFFSLCAGDDLRPGAARFLAATPNLFNVAISRARAALHLVGNRDWAARSGLDFIRTLAAGNDQEADPLAAVEPESEPECRLREALAAAGLDAIPQYPVAGRRIDLAVIAGERRLAIEVDGIAHHATAGGERSDDDHWRDLILIERGWRVLRFWAFEVRDRPGDCVARVAAALR